MKRLPNLAFDIYVQDYRAEKTSDEDVHACCLDEVFWTKDLYKRVSNKDHLY